MVAALQSRAKKDIQLEAEGKLPNYIPPDEIIVHWKRRLAVTVVGGGVLAGAIGILAWAVKSVRQQGTGLTWTS